MVFIDDNLLQRIILVLVNILAIFLGIVVFSSNKKSKTNLFFFLTTLSFVFWTIFGFLGYYPSFSQTWTLFFARLNFSFVALSLLAIYFLVKNFPNPVNKISLLDWIVCITTFIFMIFSFFSGYLIAGINLGKVWEMGIWEKFFYLFAALIVFYVVYILIGKYQTSTNDEKIKVKLFTYGAAFAGFFNVIFNAVLPSLMPHFNLFWIGDYSLLVFLGFTAYAVVKHQLFNIKVIATETAAIVINIVLIVQIFNSANITEAFLTTLFWLVILYVSFILVKSVQREIKFRQELQVMAQQLGHANAHLKELDLMKTEFVSLASHELLTPVSAIEGYLSMLLDEHMAKVEDPKAQKYLKNVYSSAKRLARLIADMLNISRIEEGRLLVEKKDVDLSELIKQVIDEIKFKSEERKQKVVFDKPDGWKTYADADKVKEVVINIIGNSIKYSKNPGTITISIEKVPTKWVSEKWQKIEEDIKKRPLDDQEAIHSAVDSHLRDFVGGSQLMIAIKDTGIGIPKEELPRLFKKFHRVGDYTTAESQGSGLGLYISRALVELHHGRIWAASEGEGKGSTFTFTLPDISDKEALLALEAQMPKQKESLKPLARPTKAAEEI